MKVHFVVREGSDRLEEPLKLLPAGLVFQHVEGASPRREQVFNEELLAPEQLLHVHRDGGRICGHFVLFETFFSRFNGSNSLLFAP